MKILALIAFIWTSGVHSGRDEQVQCCDVARSILADYSRLHLERLDSVVQVMDARHQQTEQSKQIEASRSSALQAQLTALSNQLAETKLKCASDNQEVERQLEDVNMKLSRLMLKADLCWIGTNAVNESCYKLQRTPKSWHRARSSCLELGGHLLAMETEDEFNIIADHLRLVQDPPEHRWYIGLNDIDIEDTFVWADVDKPMTIPQKWGASQPNNRNGHSQVENCGAIMTSRFYLNDEACAFNFPSVCEFEFPLN
eukprot:GHVO01025618.1.p1 GENE.GHVO01025618.1~~GHVO01025618.1.p1  ORF type:complete len:256 (+),score=6.93 GHVO01025618.1:48-815(+)